MKKQLNFLSLAAMVLTGMAVFFMSCDNGDDPAPKVATSIQLVSGGSQTGLAGQALANPVEVIVKDQEGNAFAGEVVNFAVTEGSVSAATATTDANGKASVTWTLGATEGTQTLTITGTSALTGSPLLITATANLQATSIELVSGGAQTAMTEDQLTNPIEVIVKDQNGDPFAGEVVNFAVTEGSVSAATATTDANGKASVEWTLGTTEGEQTLTITGTSTLTGSPLEVTATATYRPIIGDFRYGGVIFYIDATGQHGLVCAVTDQSTGAEWGCEGTIISGADGTAIGTGAQNTIDIIAGCATNGTAADICARLTLNSYDDWFLPSEDELYQMYQNKATINTTAVANSGTEFANEEYWTSSEVSILFARLVSLSNGTKSQALKSANDRYVRAIREF